MNPNERRLVVSWVDFKLGHYPASCTGRKFYIRAGDGEFSALLPEHGEAALLGLAVQLNELFAAFFGGARANRLRLLERTPLHRLLALALLRRVLPLASSSAFALRFGVSRSRACERS